MSDVDVVRPFIRSRIKLYLGSAFFGVWFLGVSVFGAYHLAAHLLPLPGPTNFPLTASASWRTEHYLAAKCPCSRAIAEEFLGRAPNPQMHEHVTIVGQDADLAKSLRKAGYPVVEADPEILQKTAGVEGAPWLMVWKPDGQVAYSGGYATRRPVAGQATEEQLIFQALQAGRAVAPLPSFGCATSRALRQTTDPLGIKLP